MTIQLRTDPTTGKKDIIVSLASDEDLLPHEHEQMHRALVEKLLQGGIVKAEELGKITVERDQETGVAAETTEKTGQAETERAAHAEGR